MCEKTLWAAVLKRAVKDATALPKHYCESPLRSRMNIESAREWLKSQNTEIGSFLWICDVLGLDPDHERLIFGQC